MLDVREAVEMGEDSKTVKDRGVRSRSNARKSAGRDRIRPKGLKIACSLTRKGENPFDNIEWEIRKSSISDSGGKKVFEQDGVEVPKSWSVLATSIVSSKYFYGAQGKAEREYSARQLVHRVVRTISDWGLKDGYFATAQDAENFYNELCYVCINQYGSFNSPVWFNVGLHQVYGHTSKSKSCFAWDEASSKCIQQEDSFKRPQASACFIQSVEDTMEDIMRLATSEAMLFKHGSGTGTDLSTLRSSRERLSGGGTPSGPLSFMRVFDQVAAVIKSGGKTRRAAKMQSLKVHHPDILEFIECKIREEKKAWALIEQGYDGSFGGEAYDSVMFQNANTSVRVTDDFMRAVENDGDWNTIAVVDGSIIGTYKASDLMTRIAEGTHICGDPGVQYDSTINRWHTCKNSGPINASNPCSEYMFIDNSACNLASVNLMKFVDESGRLDLETFRHVVRMFIIAQDILVDNASYPSAEIATNSHLFRPLGLGYANLGALMMSLGLPYDSDEGRAFAGVTTSLMTGYAYSASQELAKALGVFDEYPKNRDCMLDVIRMHRESVNGIDSAVCDPELRRAAGVIWKQVDEAATRTGFRNAQVTLLAPTGTIGFMMDCDTTGVEPDIALVKYKQLAGGGMMKIVNRTIRPALQKLRYTDEQIAAIIKHIDEHDTIEGAPGLKNEHLNVFDCAFRAKKGSRYIPYKAHLKMMAAVQPFLSGAISKTVNVPNETTVNEIMQVYKEGWKMGLKAIAIYRDGSKRTQPLNTGKTEGSNDAAMAVKNISETPFRKRMPDTRQSITHKFEVAGHEGYLTVGIYADGGPGELFITMAKEGSTVGGIMDSFGTAISLCLQYGVSVQELCKKFAHSRFEPSGFTKNPDIPIAKSIVDYIFRWLDMTFPDGHTRIMAGQPLLREARKIEAGENKPVQIDEQFRHLMDDAPVCDNCGSITVRNGACYRCYNCGNSMGCS